MADDAFDFAKVEKDMGYLKKFLASLRAQADNLSPQPAASLHALLDVQDKSWPAILQCFKDEVPNTSSPDAASEARSADPDDAGSNDNDDDPVDDVPVTIQADAQPSSAPPSKAATTDAPRSNGPPSDAPGGMSFTVGPLRHR